MTSNIGISRDADCMRDTVATLATSRGYAATGFVGSRMSTRKPHTLMWRALPQLSLPNGRKLKDLLLVRNLRCTPYLKFAFTCRWAKVGSDPNTFKVVARDL